jgi:hypothetical protein
VQRNPQSALRLDPGEQLVDRLQVVHLPRERRPEHTGDGDRALVEQRLNLLGGDRVATVLHRHTRASTSK